MTSIEMSKQARQVLKTALGLTPKQVSIRAGKGGSNSSIRVSIKSLPASVSINQVKCLLNNLESIRYDKGDGEILSGANNFVFVSATDGYYLEKGSILEPLVEKALRELEQVKEENRGVYLNEQISIFKDRMSSNRVSVFYGPSFHNTYCTDNTLMLAGKLVDLIESKLYDLSR